MPKPVLSRPPFGGGEVVREKHALVLVKVSQITRSGGWVMLTLAREVESITYR